MALFRKPAADFSVGNEKCQETPEKSEYDKEAEIWQIFITFGSLFQKRIRREAGEKLRNQQSV